jgi:RND family efflux transporter MFP subunit
VPLKPTYTVQRGEVVERLQFTGRIVPVDLRSLFFRTGGRVQSVYVQEGDQVTAGQVLADLESLAGLERQLAMQKLSMRRAELNVEIAQLRLDQYTLSTPAHSPGFDQEAAIKERELGLAKIALEETSLNLEELEEVVLSAQVVAPVEGQVLSLKIIEGGSVEAYQTVMLLAGSDQLEVSANLSSSDLNRLAEGMPAEVVPSGRPGEAIAGKVRRLPYPYGEGSVDDEEGNATARIHLDVSPQNIGLRLGDPVRVTVVIARAPDTLWIPPQAIRTFDGRRFVVVQEGAFQQRIDIRPGIQGDERVEILEGLHEGQLVIGP